MRNLMLTFLVVCLAAIGTARGEGLFLNAVQTTPLPTSSIDTSSTAVTVQPAAPVPANVLPGQTDYAAGAACSHCAAQRLPGVCCDRDDHCCADLWANYCRDRKPCWTPGSPRRHLDGCGLVVPHLGWFHGFGHKHCQADACAATGTDCANGIVCDSQSMQPAAAGPAPLPPSDDLLPADPSMPVDDLTPPADESAYAPEERKGPFGWKLPFKPSANPWKPKPLPTAKLKWPFPR